MTDPDPRQPITFEPVSLARRRRRFDPVRFGMVLVAVGLAVAIVKPWGAVDPARGETADATVSSTIVDPSGRPTSTDPPDAAGAEAGRAATVTWSDIASVVRAQPDWGVRAILRSPSRTATGSRSTYDERWIPIDVAAPDGGTVVGVGGRAIVALGVTFPDGRAPLDVRIWRRSPQGRLYWLDARPIARPPAQGGFIFTPPPSDPGAPAWVAGEYRIDALLGSGTIARFTVHIPDRFENVRPSSVDPPFPTELVPPTEVDPATVQVGPFATIDRRGWALESVEGPPLDDADAWLDTEPGSGRVPADRVAVAYLPRATGLGVRLADGAIVRSASISRLAPDPLANGPTPVGGGVIDRRDTDPWVVFAARRGDAWAPGVYRMDVSWADDAGLHDASWHVELRPGPYTGPPPLLAIARAWARHAGATGLVVGRAEPLEGGPRSSAIRLLRTIDEGAPIAGSGAETTCGTVVNGTPEAFGLAHSVAEPLDVTRVGFTGADGRTVDLATLQATEFVPGLTLIAPTDGATFAPGIYRLRLAGPDGSRTVTLCVGGADETAGTRG